MQSRKDNRDPRINLDNARVSKVDGINEKDVEDKKFNPKSNNSKNKRGFKKGKSSKSYKGKTSTKSGKAGNDVTWYSKNANLVVGAGRIPFATIAGSRRPDGQSTPGIMALQYLPNYTMGKDSNAMSQAFESQLSFVVHANSRTTKYDSVDLGIMELAGMEIFGILSHVVRAYGIAKYYAEENRYTASPMLAMMGFNSEDVRQNLSTMFFDINLMISLTKNIWVPNTMPLLARMIWLNSYVYQDAEGSRAQYYLFVRKYFYMYTNKLDDSRIGSTLKAVNYTNDSGTELLFEPGRSSMGMYSEDGANPVSTTYVTYDWKIWKQVIYTMINALMEDSDRGTIYGDLLKAYGAERIFAMPEMPLDYKIAPVYNATVLSQIENATIMKGQDIIAYQQRKGQFIEPIYYVGTSATVPSSLRNIVAPIQPVLNFHMANDPTPADVFEATRFIVGGAKVETTAPVVTSKVAFKNKGTSDSAAIIPSKPYVVPLFYGSEMVTNIEVGYYNYNMGSTIPTGGVANFHTVPATYVAAAGYGDSIARWCALIMPFDWSPFHYYVNGVSLTSYSGTEYLKFGAYSDASTSFTSTGILGELDNYTFLDQEVMRNLHSVAIFSLLDIPVM